MDYSYWQKQERTKPLFKDVAWSRPEQKARAGRLGIVGGTNGMITAPAAAYETARATGAGEVKVLLPDVLKRKLPPTMTDVTFGASNPSGSLARDAANELLALGQWADGVLLVGDAGRNSETAIIYEQFTHDYSGPLTITRDAVDLLKNTYPTLVERPNTLLVMSFAQAQKLFQALYYPKVLTFSMNLTSFVEALHKFTITYPAALAVLHQENLVIAHEGKVSTTPWESAMSIWRGDVATRASVYWLWNPGKVFEAVTTSLVTEQVQI